VVLPRDLVPGQGLTWIGPRLPSRAGDVVQPGDRGSFLDYEGDPEHYVVQFGAATFCCGAEDVRPDPRPPAPITRRHNAP
jgi:hypothetical protein